MGTAPKQRGIVDRVQRRHIRRVQCVIPEFSFIIYPAFLKIWAFVQRREVLNALGIV